MKKKIYIVSALLILGCSLYAAISRQADDIKKTCAEIKGMPVGELTELARKRGLRLTAGSKSSKTLHGTLTHGRVACMIKLDGDKVIESQYSFLD